MLKYILMKKGFWDQLGGGFTVLAPMDGVTDIVFRQVVARAGRPEVFFTEFTNVSSFASEKGRTSAILRLRFLPEEKPIVAQIWGVNPGHFEVCANGLREMGYEAVDINMGCPEKHVVRNGGGSALIRMPELAGEIIAATKRSGLPVSVKTRLGYTQVEEWREWLSFLLAQDLAALTVHLRTKKEMSKVVAHHELVEEIVALRDALAPGTKLIVNGDIESRVDGQKFIDLGVDGVMIGRGVFADLFCFREVRLHLPKTTSTPRKSASGRISLGSDTFSTNVTELHQRLSLSHVLQNPNTDPRISRRAKLSSKIGAQVLERVELPSEIDQRMSERIGLLKYHLDLFDQYGGRKFEPLKRFLKIYVNNFPGAVEVRERMMKCENTQAVRDIIGELEEEQR